MGKYMMKSKSSKEFSLMEISQSASLGVRTRARTLALRCLQGSAAAAAVASAVAEEDSGGLFLQLRSRRLEKRLTYGGSRQQKQQRKEVLGANPNPSSTPNSGGNSSPQSKLRADFGSKSEEGGCLEAERVEEKEEEKNDDGGVDLAIEGSFGDNLLDTEGRDRKSRETTPCSLIRDPNTVQTPGSSNRRASSAIQPNRVTRNPRSQFPTAREMDELFATAEKEQQQAFIKKYNYDPVKDMPLPGRYEWVKIKP